VVEVDVAHSARQGRSRYSPLHLTRLALHVLAGFWPQPIQWIGLLMGVVCTFAALGLGIYGVIYWIGEANFPGPLFAGMGIVFVLGVQGFILALVVSTWAESSGKSKGVPVLDRGGTVTKRVLVTGGPVSSRRTSSGTSCARRRTRFVSLDALTYAGNVENLADVMSHERLSFVHGDIRDADLVRDVVANVDVIVNAAAESHVEKSIRDGGSEFVTTNVEGRRYCSTRFARLRSSASSSSRRRRSTAPRSRIRWTRSIRSTRARRTPGRRRAPTGLHTRISSRTTCRS